jgi:hypothetical protein
VRHIIAIWRQFAQPSLRGLPRPLLSAAATSRRRFPVLLA